MKRQIVAGTLFSLLVLFPAVRSQAQETKPWIHIRVTELSEDGSKVSINLPLSLAEVALEMAPKDVIEKGRLKLQQKNLSLADLRRVWNELKASGEAEFVTVEEKDNTVRVAREGNFVRVDVQDQSDKADKADKKEAVHVRMPIEVVDALLSGDGDELNVRAAIAQLKGQHGDIVKVDGGDSQVRIWVDERSQI